MPYSQLDRSRIRMKPLSMRENRVDIECDRVDVSRIPPAPDMQTEAVLRETEQRIRHARRNGRPVVMAFGAHTIKNGLGPALIALIEQGWVTHLATNGAGIIHDWELSFLGRSSERVRENVACGDFGHWEESGYYINLAINIGSFEDRGYGESVGAFIENEGLRIPGEDQLAGRALKLLQSDPEQAAAAADILGIVRRFQLKEGWMAVPHRWKRHSPQAAAFRLGIPFTGHPMIGHDIIYNHPMNHGACLGRAALRDFLSFAESISRIEDGVYLSVGSAVMSPMIFEKSLSMAQNLAAQEGRQIQSHFIVVVDLAESAWDWQRGEPPETNPAYYLRYNKSFSRMGGTMHYIRMDNRDLLLHLYHRLDSKGQAAKSD